MSGEHTLWETLVLKGVQRVSSCNYLCVCACACVGANVGVSECARVSVCVFPCLLFSVDHVEIYMKRPRVNTYLTLCIVHTDMHTSPVKRASLCSPTVDFPQKDI